MKWSFIFGYAISPYMSDYTKNTVSLNVNTLPENMMPENTPVNSSLVLFTSGNLNKYHLNHGNKVLLLIEVNQSYCDCEGFYYQI